MAGGEQWLLLVDRVSAVVQAGWVGTGDIDGVVDDWTVVVITDSPVKAWVICGNKAGTGVVTRMLSRL